ncbi:MAG: type II toxin-antitoxin system RelE/ParE family toxin [Chlorobium sp.]|nr:type II toxin-antitoxin system RelE/ParE family toxin [Chlorobium sp.]MCW8815752.1 type II toxin-antitoxin system RelE/ParE family toxin [Chlorobium sp.]MCW8819795.1 type II toxin-antitoxin system RelE/ParE family toxin [Ignavibacteriaceae bacterium]
MKYGVFLSSDAEGDILDIWRYVANHDSSESANRLFDAIQETCLSLERFPDRGHCPPELERIHVREYREIHFKFYRIIYRIHDQKVFIYCVLDGRRSLQELLVERLIRT